MAKATLPVNYVDDALNSAMDGKRRYKVINNADGTISLEDVTTYDQVGSNFGASQLNTIGKAINESADSGKIIDDIDAIRATTQEGYIAGALALKAVDNSLVANIYVGEDGKLHKVQGGADSVLPFSGGKIEFSAFNTYVLHNTFPWNFNVEGINSIEINFISSTKSSSLSVIKMDHLYKQNTTAPNTDNKIAYVSNGNKINVDVSQCDYISLHFSATDGGGAAYIYFTIVSG